MQPATCASKNQTAMGLALQSPGKSISEPGILPFLPHPPDNTNAEPKMLELYRVDRISPPAPHQSPGEVHQPFLPAPVTTDNLIYAEYGTSNKNIAGNIGNEYRHLLPANPTTCAIEHYATTGQTSALMPLVLHPPAWHEVHESLKQYYVAASYQSGRQHIHHYTPLHLMISWKKMFLTQFPVKETIESVCQIIEYFRDNLRQKSPESPLVIAGIASGNAIFERAILEYFQHKHGEAAKLLYGSILQISDNLLMHCSDIDDKTGTYRSLPLMPVEKLSFQEAIDRIAHTQPNAGILPFASWIPMNETGWFDSLIQHPSVVGFIHLRDKNSCGNCASTYTLKETPSEGSRSRHLIPPNTVFWSTSFSVLGWGANDSLQDDWSNKVRLSTVLEVTYPLSGFGDPGLPDHLLYTDAFRSQVFCQLPLPANQNSDSDSD